MPLTSCLLVFLVLEISVVWQELQKLTQERIQTWSLRFSAFSVWQQLKNNHNLETRTIRFKTLICAVCVCVCVCVCVSRSVMSSSLWPPWTVACRLLYHGILQVWIPEWFATSFSRGSSWPRDGTQASCIAGRFFTTEPLQKPNQQLKCSYCNKFLRCSPETTTTLLTDHTPMQNVFGVNK